MSIRSRLFLHAIVIIGSAIGAAAFAPIAAAQKFQPGSVYICPNNSDTGLDCYLEAVNHLYTMCRHIKSIEVIEFGYEKAQQGVNGAKSEYTSTSRKSTSRALTRPRLPK